MKSLQGVVTALWAIAVLLPTPLQSDPVVYEYTPLASFRITWPKPQRFEEVKKDFVYSWILAELLNRDAQLSKWKCGASITSSYDLTGDWLEKDAAKNMDYWLKEEPDKRKKVQLTDCIEETPRHLRAFAPTLDQIETALRNVEQTWRQRLVQRELSENAKGSVITSGNEPPKDGETVERERVERNRVLVAARTVLSEVLVQEWPGRAMYAVASEDFADASSGSFAVWLKTLQAANKLRVEVLNRAAQRPLLTSSAYNDAAVSSDVLEVGRAPNDVGPQYILISYFMRHAELSPATVAQLKPSICRADTAMALVEGGIRAVKCAYIDVHPGIRLVLVYLSEPGRLDSGEAQIALRTIAAHSDFKQLSDNGRPYGFGKLLLVKF